MSTKQFHGVYAAVLTPRMADQSLDVASMQALLHFLMQRGIRKFAVNGATGEFCLTTPEQLQQLLRLVRAECGADAEVLCGVGAAGYAGTETLVRIAEEEGTQGLLLPMPYFFPYGQGELTAFCQAVAAATRLPILLYNLPQFTSGLTVQTVLELVQRTPNIVGVKDSSGSLDIVTALAEQAPHACRILGNDSALAESLQNGVCDGVVSGVACALPEVIQGMYGAGLHSDDFGTQRSLLDEFIEHLGAFPTPWGLKWALEARGILTPQFALPVSPQLQDAADAYRQWLRDWLPRNGIAL